MQTSISRRALLGTGAAAAALSRRARAADKPIRIGVLTDMGGPYAANTGVGSVLGAQMAVEDFMRNNASIKAEVVQADLQLKPDVAIAIARDWVDNQGIDVITDVPLSSAAFAIADLVKQKDKVAIFTGAASADVTGGHCGPNHLHFVYDTWSMPHGVVDAAVKEGRDTWFFITADYAFGHSLQKDSASFVTGAGGKVLGQALAPFPGTAKRLNGAAPNSVQAGQYAAVLHYLKAVVAMGPERARASGRAAVDQMKAMPTDDPIFGKGQVRTDGRVIHDMHLFEVKSPEQSKEPWDYYTHRRTIPADQAFRPLNQGGCTLVPS
jgi:ABC-type branched-subunit amino acid transport system substrate-binding protein